MKGSTILKTWNHKESIIDLMVANIHLLSPLTRRQETQFVTIKSPIEAVKFSDTIQLASKYYDVL